MGDAKIYRTLIARALAAELNSGEELARDLPRDGWSGLAVDAASRIRATGIRGRHCDWPFPLRGQRG